MLLYRKVSGFFCDLNSRSACFSSSQESFIALFSVTTNESPGTLTLARAAEVALTSLLASVRACCRQVRFCSHPGFDTIVSKTSALSSSASAPRRLKMNIWEGEPRYWLQRHDVTDGDGNIAPHQPNKEAHE